MTGNSCMSCIHFDAAVREREVCLAFPDGIPAEILDATLDHRSPVKGDNGIQWAPKPGLEFLAEEIVDG